MTRQQDDDAVYDAARALGDRLQALGLQVTTAESCTGGLIARALTETGGSSAWFERGFVTYSNDAKRELLGVPADRLETHGAVSEPVARAMAEGALRRSRAALALSVTGIAGPSGGTPGKPVGTVCFGWAVLGPGDAGAGPRLRSATLHLAGDRAQVRAAAALHALREALLVLDAEMADRPPTA